MDLGGKYKVTTVAKPEYDILSDITEVWNDGVKIQEDDTLTGGVWTTGAIEFADAPHVKTTKVIDLSPMRLDGQEDDLSSVVGSSTTVVEQSLISKANGSAASLSGKRVTTRKTTETTQYAWEGVYTSGQWNVEREESEVTEVTGHRSGADASATSKSTWHSKLHVYWEVNEHNLPERLSEYNTSTFHSEGSSDTLTVDDRITISAVTPGGTSQVLDVQGKGSWHAVAKQTTLATDHGNMSYTAIWDRKWDNVAQLNRPAVVVTSNSATLDRVGTDPLTGADVTYHGPQSGVPVPPRAPADWFDGLSSFGAGMGDAVSGGLTKRIREGLGYDDAVKYGGRAYGVGQVTGEVVNVGLSMGSPCALAGAVRVGMRVVNGVEVAGNVLEAGIAFRNEDYGAGLGHLAAGLGTAANFLRACFVAGTPIRTPSGSVPVESLRPGDWVLARAEDDASGEVRARRVLQCFVRVSPVLSVVAGGREIGTTGEHPFYVSGQGWVPAGSLAVGDKLVTSDGREVAVEAVRDAGRIATVYNCEVEDDHTYFVGDEGWGFDLWVHNAYDADLLSVAAKAPDKGLLTVAGRSFDKHAQRVGSTFEGLAKGSPQQKNATAQEIVDYILTHPGATDVQRVHPRFGAIVEIVEPGGLGLRYTASGKFIHFLGL